MSKVTSENIRLFLIDDHELFRQGLAQLLASRPGFSVVGTAENISAGLDGLFTLMPEMVLLDVDLGRERALEFIQEAFRRGYTGKVLIVTAGITDLEAVQLVHAGVSGIFHKHHSPEALCAAIEKISSGDVVLEPNYLKGLFSSVDPQVDDTHPNLSDRERNVLRSLLQGFSNKEIGARMDLSETSVKSILRTLFDRLGVRTRSQLVKVAIEEYRSEL